MGKRLLLIGATTGYQTRAFATAAERLGYELVLATDRCHVLEDPWGDRAIALRFEDPAGAAAVLAAQAEVDGIVAVGARPAYIAALAAARMGILYNSPASVAASRNKFLARERFHSAGLLVPEFHRVALLDGPGRAAEEALYPCVLKPLGLSASRGVMPKPEAEFSPLAITRSIWRCSTMSVRRSPSISATPVRPASRAASCSCGSKRHVGH